MTSSARKQLVTIDSLLIDPRTTQRGVWVSILEHLMHRDERESGAYFICLPVSNSVVAQDGGDDWALAESEYVNQDQEPFDSHRSSS